MALGDYSFFSPSERQYVNPGQYKVEAQAQASAKASATTELDKFYAQLEEQQREFDITMSETRNQFGESLAWEKAQFASTFKLESERLAEEQRQFDVTSEQSASELALQSILTGAQATYYTSQAQLAGAQADSTGLGDTLSIISLGLGAGKTLFGSEESGNLGIELEDLTGALGGITQQTEGLINRLINYYGG